MLDVLERQNQLQKQSKRFNTKFSDISKDDLKFFHSLDYTWMDSLTGLLNERGFSSALLREIARTNRGYNEGGILVMFNLENHHAIKAKNGNKASDTALKMVASALKEEIREMDCAARVAENEFVILFAETTMSMTLNRLQSMALRLNRLSLICSGQEIRLNLSLGLKSYSKGSRADTIFHEATLDLERNRKSCK